MIDKLLNFAIDTALSLSPFPLPAFIKDYAFVIGYAMFASAVLGGFAYFAAWVERKLIARSQSRYGPMHPGPGGILINLADMIKLLSKEDIVPDGADVILFKWAPVAMAAILFFTFILLPLSKTAILVDQSFSMILPVAFLSLIPIAILVAGWASNSKYTYMGALRSAALTMAYEIPLLLSVAGLVIMTGSFNVVEIATLQESGMWFVFLQPLGFLIFMIAVVATAERIPFDLPFAESELVAGWKTEYTGIRYMLTLLAEYGVILITSIIAVLLFFGGWSGPSSMPGLPFSIPGEFWLLFKVAIFAFFYIWMRATFPRLRIDQLLDICWKYLIPLAFVNIGIAIVVKMIWL